MLQLNALPGVCESALGSTCSVLTPLPRHAGPGQDHAMTTIETLDSQRARDSVDTQSTEQTEVGSPRLIMSLECRRPTVPGYRLMLDRVDEVIVARDAARRIERSKRSAT